MKTISSILFSLLLFGSGLVIHGTAEARMGGKPVIFVHGLQPQHLLATRGSISTQAMWNDSAAQAGNANKFFDHHFYYPSHERLTGGIAWQMYRHVKWAEQSLICKDGCLIVTASTGDLVTRYMLENLGNWRVDRNKFKILGVIDIVGAGGGTEIADLLINVTTNNNPVSWAARLALSAWLGTNFNDLTSPAAAGVLNDLRPTFARNHAKQNTPYPHIKVAGGGKEISVFGISVTDPFISGTDDGVVPLHSSCGARHKSDIHSCSNSRRIDGHQAGATGPKYNEFFHNQYPVIMAKDMTHTMIGKRQSAGTLVPIDRNLSDRSMGGYKFRLSQRTRTTGWWWWTNTYHYISHHNQPVEDVLFYSIGR